jgi:hypothetical protein
LQVKSIADGLERGVDHVFVRLFSVLERCRIQQ